MSPIRTAGRIECALFAVLMSGYDVERATPISCNRCGVRKLIPGLSPQMAVCKNRGLRPTTRRRTETGPGHRPRRGRTALRNRLTVALAEVRDRLEVWHQASRHPHQLDVALRLALETATRLDSVEVAVDVNLEERGRVIGARPVLAGIAPSKPRPSRSSSSAKTSSHVGLAHNMRRPAVHACAYSPVTSKEISRTFPVQRKKAYN
jgi:hypothetical protein